MVPRLKIAAVSEEPKSLKEWLIKLFGGKDIKPRLKPGDILAAAADIENPTFSELREVTKRYENKPLPVTVLRTTPTALKNA